MATKNYMINDKWLDLDKQNIVELQSVDGVLDSLKVNGSEIETPSGKITITENGTDIDIAQYALADVNVEGGGGSSDFSTAEVTVVNTNEEVSRSMSGATAIDDGEDTGSAGGMGVPYNTTETFLVILYKGVAWVSKGDSTIVSVTGDAEKLGSAMVMVTGDCTITIS